MKKSLLFFMVFGFSTLIINAQEIPIAVDTHGQSSPIVVNDGAKYFVSYIDRAGSGYGFRGNFVSPEGVAGPSLQLVAPHSAMSIMNDKALGNEQFLLVWSRQRGVYDYQRDAYAQLITAAGSPQGGGIKVSENNSIAANFLRVAFDGNKYLIVWQEGAPTQSSRIMGQFLSSTGTMVGSNFEIRPASLVQGNSQVYPDVLFDGNNFLVVWDDNRSGSRTIYGWFFDTDGNAQGDDFMIGQTSPEQMLVQVAHNGSNYLAVWGDGRDGNKKGVYGQLFSSGGTLIGSNFPISPLANNQERSWPRIGTNGSQYLVAWNHQTDSKAEYKASPEDMLKAEQAGISDNKQRAIWMKVYGRLLNADGTFASEELQIGVNAFHQQEPSIDALGDMFLTAWQDSRNNNQYSNIYGMMTQAEEPPVLPEPVNLTAGFIDNEVVLNWDAPVDRNVLYYKIYRNWSVLATDITQTSYVDNTFDQQTTYTYYVTAVYELGESNSSNHAEVTIPTLFVDITFWIKEDTDDQIPLQGAKITLETAGDAYTDQDGMAVFNDVAVAQELTYVVEMEGYYDLESTLEDIEQSMEMTVLLEKDYTGTGLTTKVNTSIFPNPANNWVDIHSELNIGEVLLRDLSGKILIRHDGLYGNNVRINTSSLRQGVYLVSIIFENADQKVYRLVVQ